jgi:hypothetical protein
VANVLTSSKTTLASCRLLHGAGVNRLHVFIPVSFQLNSKNLDLKMMEVSYLSSELLCFLATDVVQKYFNWPIYFPNFEIWIDVKFNFH